MSYLSMVILQGKHFISEDVLTYLQLFVAVVILRVWYILSARRTARAIVMASFAIVVAVTSHELAAMYPNFRPSVIFADSPCTPPLVANFWKLCVPELVLQTVIFAAILWPAVNAWRRGRHSQLLNRIVRECVCILHSTDRLRFLTYLQWRSLLHCGLQYVLSGCTAIIRYVRHSSQLLQPSRPSVHCRGTISR